MQRSRCTTSLFASVSFLLSLSVAVHARATIIHVPGDYPTIQAGIDAAVPGDIVEVACGTYAVPEIIMKSGITLRSETGEAGCVIVEPADPSVEGRLFRCVVDATTAIEGITFTEGEMNYSEGGPIRFEGSPTITRCTFAWNTGAFPRQDRVVKGVTSGGFSGAAITFVNSSSRVVDCIFLANSADGSAIVVSGDVQFEHCLFEGNRTGNSPEGSISSTGSTFTNCLFLSNQGYYAGGAVECRDSSFLSCVFDGNFAYGYGGAVVVQSASLFQACTFTKNVSSDGVALYVGGDVSVVSCTFVQNRRQIITGQSGAAAHGLFDGSIITIGIGASASLSRIIAFENEFVPVLLCEPGGAVSISCSNIFGNPAGDWSGCIADQLGVNGNISVNPLFCDAPNGDFHLSSLSPCLYAECGVMGALGQGCFDEKPALYRVLDVGNDQGRQVRLSWQRSLADSPTANPYVTGYAVYRKKEEFAASRATAETPQTARNDDMAILDWDYIGTVPSRGDSVYETVVPTLCDSTISEGQCLSTFFVSAMTSNPFIYYDSPPHSGYSKDNLAPPTPTSFAVAYNTGLGNLLEWDAVAAEDFAGFHVYRETPPNGISSAAEWVATTTQTSWTDPDYDGWNVQYEVTAFDVAGNESEHAVAMITTSTPLTPARLELLPNVPNPFNPTTRIPFATPTEGPVRIAVYDARGGLVRVLVDKTLSAGHHDAIWDGRDAKGLPVSSGIYLCRLEHRSEFRSRKIVLIK